MTGRWRPPGTGWIRTLDHGFVAVWMRPEQPGGVTIAVYLGGYIVPDIAEVWVVALPRGSLMPVEVMDKPHRIHWVTADPGDPQFGGRVLLHEKIRPSHAGHRRTKWTRKIYRWHLPRPIWLAIREKGPGHD